MHAGLVVEALVRRHPDFVLGPLSFEVAPGRVLGLLGANGAGKTTLLAAIAGQARVQGGAVSWNGAPVVHGAWKVRHRISFVRDIPALYGELTVAQTMAFVSRLLPTWRQARAQELLDTFRLSPGKPVTALSRGMRAKLGLLLAASHDVELLLLDEVTAGVDPDTREDIQVFLRGLARDHGVSVIVSSHLFDDIERASDDIMILARGAVAHRGTLKGLPPGSLRDLYFAHRDSR